MQVTESVGKVISLPESDLSITLNGIEEVPAAQLRMSTNYEEPGLPIAAFDVRKGDGPPFKYFAMATMPMYPNQAPDPKRVGPPTTEPLVEINYHRAPIVDDKTNGLRGAVEILGTKEGKLYYRVFGRSKDGKIVGDLRPDRGPIELGQPINAFGGNPGMPMTIAFQVDEYLLSGTKTQTFKPMVLERSQLGNGIAPSLVSMTVKDGDGRRPGFYVRRSQDSEPRWQTVDFGTRTFRIAYDINRDPLGFDVKLIDFERTFDPGTDQAASYLSRVLVNDPAHNVVDHPVTISMNEPMKHQGYTFYQSSFIPEFDARTNERTGRFQSVFRVRYDPSWQVVYLGCMLVSLGAFLQFYMRAGLFTDGGKREREMAAKKAETKGSSKNVPPAPKPASEERTKRPPARRVRGHPLIPFSCRPTTR